MRRMGGKSEAVSAYEEEAYSIRVRAAHMHAHVGYAHRQHACRQPAGRRSPAEGAAARMPRAQEALPAPPVTCRRAAAEIHPQSAARANIVRALR